jgi:hypothetical protein
MEAYPDIWHAGAPQLREFLDRIFAGVPEEDRRKITSDTAAQMFRFAVS